MDPAKYYPPCTRQELAVAPMLGWNHAGKLLSYALGARNILEYGSGGSTLWLAMHCENAHILSVEHALGWAIRIGKAVGNLVESSIQCKETVRILYAPTDDTTKGYAQHPEVISRAPFDLIVIDGAHEQRTPCLKAAYGLLSPGGVTILDNSEEPAYQEGKTFLLAQPGMILIEETEDETWDPNRSHRKMWIVQKSQPRLA